MNVRCSLAAALVLACSAAYASDPSNAAAELPSVSTATPGVAIPADTLVALRIEQNLSSGTSHRGDKFALSLLNDVWIGNQVILPAGTKGIGEVIHAAGKGFGGRAGELIVTARYLEYRGQQIPLKNFRLGAAGADNSTAAVFSSAIVPLAGLFVTGTSASVGVGQMAQAKIAQDVIVTTAGQD